MDINTLLRGVSDCPCGKPHTCAIEYVYVERGAVSRLANICENDTRVLLVADENTYAAAGALTEDALKGKEITRVIFASSILVPDETAIATVTERLGDAEVIIGIGSGVIQDLCKYVSHFGGVPYIVVATAPSMDGYASNGAAMITDGMKVTYPAGLPKAILADTAVLAAAPMEMIKAGYGDILGKFSALNDWKLSHLINGEYFCQYIYDLTYDQIRATLKLADDLLRRDEEAVKTLMEALVVVGILMSFAGSSRPASGSEHHLSHFFEITGILNDTPYFSHGIDVAYSTVVTTKVREALLRAPFPKTLARPSHDEYTAEMNRLYKTSADGCMALQEKMGRYHEDPVANYLTHETAIKEILAETPSAAELETMLAAVDLPMDEFYAFYGKDHIRDAVWYAKDLKDRYTVLWLYYDLYGGKQDV